MDKGRMNREKSGGAAPGEKAALRTLIRERLKNLTPEERTLQSCELCRHLSRFLTKQGLEKGSIATFHPFGPETDLTGLRELLPHARFYYPLCREGNSLTFHRVDHPAAELRKGLMGLREPDASLPSLPVSDLDAVLVPGLAFTPQGARLGKGGGYYDRTLSSSGTLPLLLGTAFPCQIVNALPSERHDHPVDRVFTADSE